MKTIDEYIESFDPEIRNVLMEIRNFIKNKVPGATEKISYGMPTFFLNGNLIHFAAFKDHYGFYLGPSGTGAFEKKLAPYRCGKGTLCFEMDKPIPWDIIQKVLEFRVKENSAKKEKKARQD